MTKPAISAFQIRNADVPTLRYRWTNLDDVVVAHMNADKATNGAFDSADEDLAKDNIDFQLASEYSDLHFTDLDTSNSLSTVLISFPLRKSDGNYITSSDLGIEWDAALDSGNGAWKATSNIILSLEVAAYGGANLLQDGTEYQAFLETWMASSDPIKNQLAGAPPAPANLEALGTPDLITVSFDNIANGEASAGYGTLKYVSVTATKMEDGTQQNKQYTAAELSNLVQDGKVVITMDDAAATALAPFQIESGKTYEISVFARNDFAAGPTSSALVSASNRPNQPTNLIVDSASAGLSAGEVLITFDAPFTAGKPKPTGASIQITTRDANATPVFTASVSYNDPNANVTEGASDFAVSIVSTNAGLQDNVAYKCTVISTRTLALGETDNADGAVDGVAKSLPAINDFNYVNLSQPDFVLATSLDQLTRQLDMTLNYPAGAETLPSELAYTFFYTRIRAEQAVLDVLKGLQAWQLASEVGTTTFLNETGLDRDEAIADGDFVYALFDASQGVEALVESVNLPESALYTSVVVNASLFATYTVGSTVRQVKPISRAQSAQTVTVTAAPPAVDATTTSYAVVDDNDQGLSVYNSAEDKFEGRIEVTFTEVVASKIDSEDIYYDVYAIKGEDDGQGGIAFPNEPVTAADLLEADRVGRFANNSNASGEDEITATLPNLPGKDGALEVGANYMFAIVARFNDGNGALSSDLCINKSNANPAVGNGYVMFGKAESVENLSANLKLVAPAPAIVESTAELSFTFPLGVTTGAPFPGLDSNTVRIEAAKGATLLKFVEDVDGTLTAVDFVDVTYASIIGANISKTLKIDDGDASSPADPDNGTLVQIGDEVTFTVTTIMVDADGNEYNGEIASFASKMAAAPVISVADYTAGAPVQAFSQNGTTGAISVKINNKGALLRELIMVPITASGDGDAVWARIGATSNILTSKAASDADQIYTVSFEDDNGDLWNQPATAVFVVAENREGLDAKFLESA